MSGTLLAHVAALLAHCIFIGAQIGDAEQRLGACGPHEQLVSALPCLLVLGLQGMTCTFFAIAKAKRSLLSSCDAELCSLAATSIISVAVVWLPTLASEGCWGAPTGAENTRLAVASVVTWYCLFVPIRWCRLWVFPVLVWGSFVGVATCTLPAFLAAEAVKVALMCVTFISIVWARRSQERRLRGQWLSERSAAETLTAGMHVLLKSLCDGIVTITDEFVILGAAHGSESFFGRSVDGARITELMPPADACHFIAAMSEVSEQQTVVKSHLTVYSAHGPVEVSILAAAMGPGRCLARYVVSFSLSPGSAEPPWASLQERGPRSPRSTGRPQWKRSASLQFLREHLPGAVSEACFGEEACSPVCSFSSITPRSEASGRPGRPRAVSLAYSDSSASACGSCGPEAAVAARPGAARAEAETQTPAPEERRDAGANTVVTWREVGFACATCGRPPTLPGRPLAPAASQRSGGRAASGRRPSRSPSRSYSSGSSGRGGAGAPRGPSPSPAPNPAWAPPAPAGAETAVFDGLWRVLDSHSEAVSPWLRRLRIRGSTAVDACGDALPVVLREGGAYLQDGLLSLEGGLLYRTGLSGRSLAFVRVEDEDEAGASCREAVDAAQAAPMPHTCA